MQHRLCCIHNFIGKKEKGGPMFTRSSVPTGQFISKCHMSDITSLVRTVTVLVKIFSRLFVSLYFLNFLSPSSQCCCSITGCTVHSVYKTSSIKFSPACTPKTLLFSLAAVRISVSVRISYCAILLDSKHGKLFGRRHQQF